MKKTFKINIKLVFMLVIIILTILTFNINSYARDLEIRGGRETRVIAEPISLLEETNKLEIAETEEEFLIDEMTQEKLKNLGIAIAIDNNGKFFFSEETESKLKKITEDFNNIFADPFVQSFFVVILSIIGIIVIIKGIFVLIQFIAKWVMYRKANKPGWALLLPVYKDVIMLEIVGLSPALLLLYFTVFIPYVGVFIYLVSFLIIKIIIAVNLSRAFGKQDVFALGLLFLPTIFLSILGFGKAKYDIESINKKKEKKKEKNKNLHDKEKVKVENEVKEIEAKVENIDKEEKKEETENK